MSKKNRWNLIFWFNTINTNFVSNCNKLNLVFSSKSECGGIRTSDNPNEPSLEDEDAATTPSFGENSYTSLRCRKMALRRKRSLSVADLPVPKQPNSFPNLQKPSPAQTGYTNNYKPVETGFDLPERRILRHTETQTRRIGGFTAEESGYDSDATRKSSPRSSLKNDAAIASNGGKVIVGSSDDCDSR